MPDVTMAVVSDSFGRDLDECFIKIARHVAAARERGVELLALPEAALGGYLYELSPDEDAGPSGHAPFEARLRPAALSVIVDPATAPLGRVTVDSRPRRWGRSTTGGAKC